MKIGAIEDLFIASTGMTHWGLPVVEIDGAHYAVAENDDMAQKAARDAVHESLWAFNPSFLRQFLPSTLEDRHSAAIAKMQSELCEDAQPIIELLLGDNLDAMIDAAIEAVGRGHFLSDYDGEEYNGEDIHEIMEGKLLYRTA